MKKGFTIPEILVLTLIVAVSVITAVVLYQSSQEKLAIIEIENSAKEVLTDISDAEVQYFREHKKFTSSFVDLNLPFEVDNPYTLDKDGYEFYIQLATIHISEKIDQDSYICVARPTKRTMHKAKVFFMDHMGVVSETYDYPAPF